MLNNVTRNTTHGHVLISDAADHVNILIDSACYPHPNQRPDGLDFLVDAFRAGGSGPRVDSARAHLAHPLARRHGRDLH